MNDEIKVVETTKHRLKKPVVINGFPEVGIVGSIAVSHMIKALKLSEIGYIDSKPFLPIVVVHNRRPKAPIRIYGNEEIAAVISEIPIPLFLIPSVSKSLVEWFKSIDARLALLLGGIAHPNRSEVEMPEVYGVSSNKESEEILKKSNIKFLEEGFIMGPNGIILHDCMERELSSIYIMAEAHYGYPDPGAAASVITAANKILGLDIEVKPLLEKEEEIRIMTRDLMKRTQEAMKGLQKRQEQEMPIMYG